MHTDDQLVDFFTMAVPKRKLIHCLSWANNSKQEESIRWGMRVSTLLTLSVLSPDRSQSCSHICPHVVRNHGRERPHLSHSESKVTDYINI